MARLLLLLVAAALPAAQTGTALEARFIGNMAFAITDGAVTLVSDFPYESGAFGYMTYEPAAAKTSTAGTLALVTHRHDDHWQPRLFNATGWKVLAPQDATGGLAADRVLAIASSVAFGPMTIEPIATPHASVGHYSYLVTWHGRRLYFTGDTESTDALLAARDLDVAFVSPWLLRAVSRDGARIDADRIVVYHHRVGETVTGCGATCVVPAQGDVLRF